MWKEFQFEFVGLQDWSIAHVNDKGSIGLNHASYFTIEYDNKLLEQRANQTKYSHSFFSSLFCVNFKSSPSIIDRYSRLWHIPVGA